MWRTTWGWRRGNFLRRGGTWEYCGLWVVLERMLWLVLDFTGGRSQCQ
ncbi:hypothetical protein HanIR_Chr01g0033241 [Helianthus annuus]|nr:hypothetical protein HanIR_Chr01g0033241 [Helianthus annuus]